MKRRYLGQFAIRKTGRIWLVERGSWLYGVYFSFAAAQRAALTAFYNSIDASNSRLTRR